MTKLTLARRIAFLLFSPLSISLDSDTVAQQRHAPSSGRLAVVVDERLSALRDAPDLSANLIRRLGRGRVVGIRAQRPTRDGIVFYRVSVTKRTQGWIQREALASPSIRGDDERLLFLIRASKDFDRIARAKIFLDLFRRSVWRPAVLLIYAESAEAAATRLTRDATRRVNEVVSSGNFSFTRATEFSYFMNYSGLDRYNRVGVRFLFDVETKKFRYDGAAWRELIRHYPRSVEAGVARERVQ
jgi:hypothetical protein